MDGNGCCCVLIRVDLKRIEKKNALGVDSDDDGSNGGGDNDDNDDEDEVGTHCFAYLKRYSFIAVSSIQPNINRISIDRDYYFYFGFPFLSSLCWFSYSFIIANHTENKIEHKKRSTNGQMCAMVCIPCVCAPWMRYLFLLTLYHHLFSGLITHDVFW